MADFLWQKDTTSIDDRVMAFLAADDVVLDRQLFVYDLRASRAHARALANIDLLVVRFRVNLDLPAARDSRPPEGLIPPCSATS